MATTGKADTRITLSDRCFFTPRKEFSLSRLTRLPRKRDSVLATPPSLSVLRNPSMAFPRFYKLEQSGTYGLSMPVEPILVPGAMAVTVTISTQNEDRSGDIVVTSGIDTSNHAKSPCVFYDHALAHIKIPVGKAKDPQGNYTVTLLPGKVVARTYFAQSIPEGEQVYRLIEEGILCGASIGFKPLEGYDLPVTSHFQQQAGMVLRRTELLEYSHTPIPDNPDCLVEALAKSYLTSPILRKSFSAAAPPRKHQITVPELPMSQAAVATPPAETKPAEQAPVTPPAAPAKVITKGADTSEYAPLAATPGTNAAGVNPDGDEGMNEDKDLLPGACALKGAHSRVMELSSFLAGQDGRHENDHVRGLLDELAKSVDEHAGAIADKYAEQYPDYEPLDDGPADEDEDDPEEKERKEKSSEEADGGDSMEDSLDHDDYSMKSAKRWAKRQEANGKLWKRICAYRKKRSRMTARLLSKSAAAVCARVAGFLAGLRPGPLDETGSAAAAQYSALLKSVASNPELADDTEVKALKSRVEELAATAQKLARQLKAAKSGR
jgi:hypothetical protein